MAEEENKGGKGLVEQVVAEMKKARRESVKGKVKGLLAELEKVNETRRGIDATRQGIIDKIAEEVASLEEGEVDLADLLK